LIIDGLFASCPQLELKVSNRLVMGMLLMKKGRSPCQGMDLSAEGGREVGAHRLESNIPSKKANMFRKMFDHFCCAKMFKWGLTFL
jgi:hypothetical protein